jgi:hypothetical protein
MTVYVEKSKNTTLEDGIDNLMNAMIEDYKSMGSPDWDNSTDMEKRYAEGFTAKKGKKYIKIISNGSAKCFVVAVENDKKFRKGDVLFASSWDAPARNRARGNVIDGGYGINWTGAEYL